MSTVDWFRVLADMQRCGMSLRQVSSRTGVTRWIVYRVWRGTTEEFRHSDGERVLQLWAKATKRNVADAPKLLVRNEQSIRSGVP